MGQMSTAITEIYWASKDGECDLPPIIYKKRTLAIHGSFGGRSLRIAGCNGLRTGHIRLVPFHSYRFNFTQPVTRYSNIYIAYSEVTFFYCCRYDWFSTACFLCRASHSQDAYPFYGDKKSHWRSQLSVDTIYFS
jgi:hypothetical protein